MYFFYSLDLISRQMSGAVLKPRYVRQCKQKYMAYVPTIISNCIYAYCYDFVPAFSVLPVLLMQTVEDGDVLFLHCLVYSSSRVRSIAQRVHSLIPTASL